MKGKSGNILRKNRVYIIMPTAGNNENFDISIDFKFEVYERNIPESSL